MLEKASSEKKNKSGQFNGPGSKPTGKTLAPPPFQLSANQKKNNDDGQGNPVISQASLGKMTILVPPPPNNPNHSEFPTPSPEWYEYDEAYKLFQKTKARRTKLAETLTFIDTPQLKQLYIQRIRVLNGQMEQLSTRLNRNWRLVPEHDSQTGSALYHQIKIELDAVRSKVGQHQMPGDGKESAEKVALRQRMVELKKDLAKAEADRRSSNASPALRAKYFKKANKLSGPIKLDKDAAVSNGAFTSQKGNRNVTQLGDELRTKDQLTINKIGLDSREKTRREVDLREDKEGVTKTQIDHKSKLDYWDKSYDFSKETTVTKQPADEKKNPTTTFDTNVRKLDLTGYEHGKEDIDVEKTPDSPKGNQDSKSGDKFTSRKHTGKIERGEGKFGAQYNGQRKDGKTDPKGPPESAPKMGAGVEHNGNIGGGALVGPNGVGAYGSGGYHGKSTDEAGNQKQVGVDFGGKLMVAVKDIGGDPKQYAVTILVAYNAGAFYGHGKEGEVGDGGPKGKIGGKLKVDHSNVYSITKHLTESEKAAYLAEIQLAKNGKGTPKHPELGIITVMTKRKGEVSKAVFDQFKADQGMADDAKTMKDGESINNDAKTTGAFEVEGEIGPIGLSFGLSKSVEKKKNLRIVGNNAILTVSINNSDGQSAGASVKMPGLRAGGKFGSSKSQGHAVRVTIPKDDPKLQAIANELSAARTDKELLTLKAKYPQINVSNGTMEGRSESAALDAELSGALGIGFNASSEYSAQEFDDGSATYHGANGLGGHLSLLGVKMASNSKEAIDANVDAKGNATADLGQTDTSFNLGKSLDQLRKNLNNDPWGLASGGAKNIKEDKDLSGTFLSNKETDHLIRIAHSKEYDNYINSPQLREEWKICVQKIRKGGNDRQNALKALAEFLGNARHGKKEALETMLASNGHHNGGARYEFPDGTEALKPDYEWLLRSSPADRVTQLVYAKKGRASIQLAQDILDKIEKVEAGLQAAGGKFEDKTRLADMLIFLSNLKAQVNGQRMQLTNPNATPKDLIEQTERIRFDDALGRLKTYRQQESALFAEIEAQKDDDHLTSSETIHHITLVNKMSDLYKRWDDDLATVKYLNSEKGIGGADFDPESLAPNKKKLNNSSATGAKTLQEMDMNSVHQGVEKVYKSIQSEKQKELQAEKRAQQAERNKISQRWIGQVMAKAAVVTEAKSLSNVMSSRSEKALMNPKAVRSWNTGYAFDNKAKKAMQQLKSISYTGTPAEIAKTGQNALSLYQSALDGFKRGNQIQNFGG